MSVASNNGRPLFYIGRQLVLPLVALLTLALLIAVVLTLMYRSSAPPATGWYVFAAYPDEASASVIAQYLRLNDCWAVVLSPCPGPDLAPLAGVLVPRELQHRAHWLWEQAEVSEGELIYLSTGEFPGGSGDLPLHSDAA